MSAPLGSNLRRLPRGKFVPRVVAADQALHLTDHLDELRKRLIFSLIAIGAAFVGAFMLRAELIGWLNQPLGDIEPITLSVAEPFTTSIKVSAFAALAVVMPVIAWQMWSFIAPAFGQSGRKTVVVLSATGSLLFAIGATFAALVALPSAVQFLTSFDSALYETQIRAADYYIFAAAVIFSIGLIFQMPLVLLGLIRLGALKAQALRQQRRIAYVILTVIAVCLPGVDPALTAITLVPLALLYEGTILASRFVNPAPKETPEPIV